MEIIVLVLQAALFAVIPALAIRFAPRSKALSFLDPVVICYLAGIAAANTPLARWLHPGLIRGITEGSVVLAIPLLLFSAEVSKWLTVARGALLSFAAAMITVVAITLASATWLFDGLSVDLWKIAGMLVGVYTAGTPNMNAIGIALRVPEETFLIVNAADIALGALYLPLILTGGSRLIRRIYSRTPSAAAAAGPATEAAAPAAFTAARPVVVARRVLVDLILSAAVLGLSLGVSWAATGGVSPTLVIMGVTSFALCASFVGPVRRLPGTYEVGQYILLIFCLAIGSLADAAVMVQSLSGVAAFVATVFCGSVVVHFALAALLRIDADTAIITSTAAIFGPAFIGPVATALGNRNIVVPGLTTSIIGLAIGNYLGLMVAHLLAP